MQIKLMVIENEKRVRSVAISTAADGGDMSQTITLSAADAAALAQKLTQAAQQAGSVIVLPVSGPVTLPPAS